MKELEVSDERIIRASDLLEQISAVDEMIDLHKQKGDEQDLMLLQYQDRRARFLKELKEVLAALNIKPTDLAA
ncbi:MAG: hypothetical protein R2824_22875 [Saprospiraceae bacterium]|nr:hypothetical protein [Lewinella sp.]